MGSFPACCAPGDGNTAALVGPSWLKDLGGAAAVGDRPCQGRLNAIRSPANALSLASFDKRSLLARTSFCPTPPPTRSAPVAGVAWFRPVAVGRSGRRTIVTADPTVIGNAIPPDDEARKLRTIAETAQDVWSQA